MTVFIGHVSGARFTAGLLWQFGPRMGEAVAVFFALSGFVIGYAADRKPVAKAYAVDRLARVYSVALPALVITFALDAAGRAVRPDLYSAAWGYQPEGQLWQFVSGLLFVNQAWGLDVPQGSDLPYWSLGYEVWYYVIFGLAAFGPPRWRVAGVLLATAFAGPAIAALLPLWLLGLLGYRVSASHRTGRRAGWALFAGTLAVWAAYEAFGRAWLAGWAAPPAILKRPSLAEDYLVGSLFVLHVIGFDAVSSSFRGLARAARGPVRWMAGATFTIYLLHLPVAQFLTTQVPWPPGAWQTRAVLFAGTLAILLAMAEVTERRKEPWRRAFAALLGRVRTARPVR